MKDSKEKSKKDQLPAKIRQAQPAQPVQTLRLQSGAKVTVSVN